MIILFRVYICKVLLHHEFVKYNHSLLWFFSASAALAFASASAYRDRYTADRMTADKQIKGKHQGHLCYKKVHQTTLARMHTRTSILNLLNFYT